MKVNQERWEELKQIEIGLARPSVAKLKCFYCSSTNILDDIRKFECGHDYCVKCVKDLMTNYKGGAGLKCKCSRDIEADVLEGVDKGLYNSYIYKLSNSQGYMHMQPRGPRPGNYRRG